MPRFALMLLATSGAMAMTTTAPPSRTLNAGILTKPVDRFCRGTNALMRRTCFASIREKIDLREATASSPKTFREKALSPPEYPGVSRPVLMVILCSVPTALGWYGYYKYSVEEELFQEELRTTGFATGCGGYGTLLPFVYCFLLGGVGTLAGIPGSDALFTLGGAWILLGQINLYRRVNELCETTLGEQPLHPWWALLPPPFDVIVGLRQVHFLARHWASVRGDEWEGDAVAEKYFPFIDSERFTLKELARTPSNWFWFTKDAKDLEFDFLE